MSRSWVITFLLVLLMPAMVHASKPVNPLALTLETDVEPQPEQQLTLTATLSSRVALKDVTLELQLPEGVELVAGSLKKVVTLNPKQAVVAEYWVRLGASLSGAITIRAFRGGKKTVTYAAQDRLVLAKRAPRAISQGVVISPPYTIRERNGEKLREYTLP